VLLPSSTTSAPARPRPPGLGRGVKLSGLIIDAGPVNSPVLLSVGTPGPSSASDPDLVQDVYFRIGGAETTPVSATVSLLDNAGNSIIDNVWAWRADHGNAVGWTVNTAVIRQMALKIVDR